MRIRVGLLISAIFWSGAAKADPFPFAMVKASHQSVSLLATAIQATPVLFEGITVANALARIGATDLSHLDATDRLSVGNLAVAQGIFNFLSEYPSITSKMGPLLLAPLGHEINSSLLWAGRLEREDEIKDKKELAKQAKFFAEHLLSRASEINFRLVNLGYLGPIRTLHGEKVRFQLQKGQSAMKLITPADQILLSAFLVPGSTTTFTNSQDARWAFESIPWDVRTQFVCRENRVRPVGIGSKRRMHLPTFLSAGAKRVLNIFFPPNNQIGLMDARIPLHVARDEIERVLKISNEAAVDSVRIQIQHLRRLIAPMGYQGAEGFTIRPNVAISEGDEVYMLRMITLLQHYSERLQMADDAAVRQLSEVSNFRISLH